MCLCRCERGRALIPSSRCRLRGRRCRGCGTRFPRRLAPHMRDVRDKRCNTSCDKRNKRQDYSAYRCSGHNKHAGLIDGYQHSLVKPALIFSRHQVRPAGNLSVRRVDQAPPKARTLGGRAGRRLPPKVLESIRRQLCVTHGVLDVPVPEICLQRPGVVALVGRARGASVPRCASLWRPQSRRIDPIIQV
jgi:hypothetical protein